MKNKSLVTPFCSKIKNLLPILKETCPKCGQPMEDFAVNWSWGYCYNCSWEIWKAKRGELS